MGSGISVDQAGIRKDLDQRIGSDRIRRLDHIKGVGSKGLDLGLVTPLKTDQQNRPKDKWRSGCLVQLPKSDMPFIFLDHPPLPSQSLIMHV